MILVPGYTVTGGAPGDYDSLEIGYTPLERRR